MGHYRSNVRDLEFNLFEVLGLDAVLDSGAYGDLDTATVREILGEVARLAEGPIADSFVEGDRNPPRFVPINCLRPALRNRAETAAPCADIAQKHECGRALIPAFPDIGALRGFANRHRYTRLWARPRRMRLF